MGCGAGSVSRIGTLPDEIAWETLVWAADAPSHVIHFNGEQLHQPTL